MNLRILTYNIHRAIGMDRRFRPSRIVEILAYHTPDVALLQEVDEGVPRSRRLDLAGELANSLGYPHVAVGHNVFLRRGRYGNATLSRYPIVRERNIDLTVGTHRRRGCQHSTLRIQKVHGRSQEIEVFNLHLGLSARERTRQLGLLVRSGEFASLPEERACLVGGDFNDWRGTVWSILVEILGFRCATRRGAAEGRAIRTFPAFSPASGLDRIYFRGPLRLVSARRCRLGVSKVASDHLPVIVDFELH